MSRGSLTLLLLTLLPALPLMAQPVDRVVALAPHITELVYEVGGGERLVGVVSHSDYPPEAVEIERVGDYNRLDLERIIALAPDLVLSWPGGNPPRQLQRLQSLGVRVVAIDPQRLDQVGEALILLGDQLGLEERAAQVAQRYRSRLAALRARYGGRPPLRIFYQVWHQPLMTIGRDHIISEGVRLCGGQTLFDDLPGVAPPVDLEAVITADPQLVVGNGRGDQPPAWLDQWRRWSGVSAVANRALYWIDPDLIQRPTPRLLDGIGQLCQLMERVRRGDHLSTNAPRPAGEGQGSQRRG